MVLSGKSASISSIVNRNQGGGMKKAGLAPTETASVAQRRAYGGTHALAGDAGGLGKNGRAGLLNLKSMRAPRTSNRVVIGGIGMRFTSR